MSVKLSYLSRTEHIQSIGSIQYDITNNDLSDIYLHLPSGIGAASLTFITAK